MAKKMLKDAAAEQTFELPPKPGTEVGKPAPAKPAKSAEEIQKAEAAKKAKEAEKAAAKAKKDAEKQALKAQKEAERAKKKAEREAAKAAAKAAGVVESRYKEIPGYDYKPNFISKPALELLLKIALPKVYEGSEGKLEWKEANNVLTAVDYKDATGGKTAKFEAYMSDKDKSTIKLGSAVNVIARFLEMEVLPDIVHGLANDAWIKGKRMTSKITSPPRIYAGGSVIRKGTPALRENAFIFADWPGKALFNTLNSATNTYTPNPKYFGENTDFYHVFSAKFASTKVGTVSYEVAKKLAKPRAEKTFKAQTKAWNEAGKPSGTWTMGKGKSAKKMNGQPKMKTDKEIEAEIAAVNYVSPPVLGNIQLIGDRLLNRITKGDFKMRPAKAGSTKKTGLTEAEAKKLNSLVPVVEGKQLKFMLSSGVVSKDLKEAAAKATEAWAKTVKTQVKDGKTVIASDDANLRAKAMDAKAEVIKKERESSAFFMVEKILADYAMMIAAEGAPLLKASEQVTFTPPQAWDAIKTLQKKIQQDQEIAHNQMKAHDISGQSKTVLFFAK